VGVHNYAAVDCKRSGLLPSVFAIAFEIRLRNIAPECSLGVGISGWREWQKEIKVEESW